jgi:glyoxalase family protein
MMPESSGSWTEQGGSTGGVRLATVLGIHHVTAIVSDPQRSLDFYTGVLGLHLVKRSVNQDDPTTWHLFFGNDHGDPGTAITVIAWPDGTGGRVGGGQVASVAFSIPPDALGFWVERLIRYGVRADRPTTRRRGAAGDERVLAFRDPDGLMLELVTQPDADERLAWTGHPEIPAAAALRGFHLVTAWVDRLEPSERLLVDGLGFRRIHQDGTTTRYAIGEGRPGQLLDIRAIGGFADAVGGVGTVHHVAWSVPDDLDETALRTKFFAAGLEPSDVIDRFYFRSLYVHEPGGVLYEFATLGPGLMIDESATEPGRNLTLPPEFESDRAAIMAAVPPLRSSMPSAADIAGRLLARAEMETTMPEINGFTHRYDPPTDAASGAPTLLLLHGTGGDETSLTQVGEALSPGAGLLSPRGKVLEGAAPRFFRRLAEGVLDQEDLALRTAELARFVAAAAAEYGFAADRVVAVGFSNGANIAASLLFRNPETLHGAVLLSPMLPFEPETLPDLTGTGVFIGAGQTDPLVPVEQVEALASLYERAGADVTLHWERGGHQIAASEVASARTWLNGLRR